MTHRDGLPRLRLGAWGAATQDIGSRARRHPKALASRRSGHPRDPSEGVGRSCRPVLRSGAATAEGGWAASPAAILLPDGPRG